MFRRPSFLLLIFLLVPLAVTAAPRDLRDIWNPPPDPILPQRVPVLTGLDAPPHSAPDGSPSVVLITVDTWRADRLGLYGSDRPTSLFLEAVAEDSIVFDQAYAPSSWTWPTMVSIASGLSPRAHTATKPERKLCDEAETLAEVFHDGGYRTGFSGSNIYFEAEDNGFRQGFEFFFAAGDEGASRVLEYMGYFLEGAQREPFLLQVHFFDPHCPYDPDEEILARVREVPVVVPDSDGRAPIGWKALGHACHAVPPMPRNSDIEPSEHPLSSDPAEYLDRYDAELAETDYALRLVRSMLGAEELWDDSWIIIVGDHGEEFGEHGQVGHGKNVFASTTRVPLLIRPPGGTEARRIGTPVSLVDLPPTIARAVGLEPPASWQGRDLGPALRGEELPTVPVVSETIYLNDHWAALLVDEGKRFTVGGLLPIARMFDGGSQLDGRNLLSGSVDPALRMQAAVLAARLRGLLQAQSAGRACGAEDMEYDPIRWEGLKALGYTSEVDPANRIREMDLEPAQQEEEKRN